MNKKTFYKITVADESGKVVKEIKTDCIMAAINDPDETGVACVYAASCNSQTIFNTLKGLDSLKKGVLEQNPELKMLMLASSFDKLVVLKDAPTLKKENAPDKEAPDKEVLKNAT
jgi:hypothetical protein